MAVHKLRLVYDGMGATHHKMPPSLVKQITAGAQEFLGSHAYFFTEGRIPTNVNDHSRYFQLHDLQQRNGSWEAVYIIELVSGLANDFVQEYAKELTKELARDAAAATKLGFAYLIYRSFTAWKARRPLRDDTFDRIEPVLSFSGGNGQPLFDAGLEAERQRRSLYERTDSSFAKMTAPIGRAAEHVDVWFDDTHLDRLVRRSMPEAEITDAVLHLREVQFRRKSA
jgi:hypothetical protein